MYVAKLSEFEKLAVLKSVMYDIIDSKQLGDTVNTYLQKNLKAVKEMYELKANPSDQKQ